jgi:CDP-diacylglycerol--glycerol-3-phosphate 3-phosphatidyltransferase
MRAGTEQPPPTTEREPPSARRRSEPRRDTKMARRLQALRDKLVASRLTPNQISMAGFVLNVIAAVLVWQHEFFIGGVVFIIGSICDTLDGGYSRMSGKGTPFGAFLDSTLDRIVEGFVLTAIAVTFTQEGDQLAVAAVVSDTRARAEALGVECKVGIADRLVRVIILSAGLVFADLGLLAPAVYVLAALTSFTVVQRILHVKRQLQRPAAV